MEEIYRRQADEGHNAVGCVVCGKSIHLHFNGGELDWAECCGHEYRLEYPCELNLVVRKE